MKVRVTLAPAAERDLDEIGAYLVEQASGRTALDTIQRLRARIDQLRKHPRLGAADDRLGGRRRLLERPYVIIYLVSDVDDVRVLRIAHGARDLPNLIFED